MIAHRRLLTTAAAALVAWLGMLVHNMADLPIAWSSPENTIPGLVWIALLALWAASGAARWAAALLLTWGMVNVIGAVVTVLPLALLPFEPEQSFRHYAFHALYAVTQVPLLLRALGEVRGRRRHPSMPTGSG